MYSLAGPSVLAGIDLTQPGGLTGADNQVWFSRSMRWAQLAFVENDPGRCDPMGLALPKSDIHSQCGSSDLAASLRGGTKSVMEGAFLVRVAQDESGRAALSTTS